MTQGYINEGLVVLPTTDSGWASYLDGSRLFVPGATNYWLNPRLKEGATPGQWWSEGIAQAPHGTPVYDILPNGDGSYYHEITYEVTADDLAAGGQLLLYCGTDAGNFTNADPVTLAMEYQLFASNARSLSAGSLGHLDQAYGDSISTPMPAAAVWTPISVSGVCGAATTSRQPWISAFTVNQGTGVAGDIITFRMRYPSLVKSAVLTPYFDGSTIEGGAGVCAWTGAVDASASTRVASDLILAGYVEITSAGVVPVGAKYAYYCTSTGPYFGPVIVTDTERDAGEIAAIEAAWDDLDVLWSMMGAGDLLLPLAADGVGYLKLSWGTQLGLVMANLVEIQAAIASLRAWRENKFYPVPQEDGTIVYHLRTVGDGADLAIQTVNPATDTREEVDFTP